jgi:hypothetical protein
MPSTAQAVLLPPVEVEIALGLQRGLEHALAGHDRAVVDLLRRAVGDDRHLVAGALQAEGGACRIGRRR